jgi:hypothetical protein
VTVKVGMLAAMHRGRERIFASVVPILACAALSGGCTVTMYQGPRRPRSETALITTVDTKVQNIDGMDLPVGSKFMVLPGEHSLTAKSIRYVSSAPRTICFTAAPGETYVVRTFDGFSDDRPGIWNATTIASTRMHAPSADGRCAAQPERAAPAPRPPTARTIVAPDPEPAASTDPAIAGAGSSPSRGGPRAAVDEDDMPVNAPPSTLPSPVVAAPRAVPARDDDAPRFERPRRVDLSGAGAFESAPAWVHHPGNSFVFEIGAFFGGTDLVTADLSDGSSETLSAGQGLGISLGGMWTPLWAADAAGFGLGFDAGVIYDSVGGSNASVSFTRFPIGLTAHTLLRLDDRWLWMFKAGIRKELDIGLSGAGDADSVPITGDLGVLGEAGIYYVLSSGDQHGATSFTIRYTASHDSIGGASVSASNIGLVWTTYYNF